VLTIPYIGRNDKAKAPESGKASEGNTAILGGLRLGGLALIFGGTGDGLPARAVEYLLGETSRSWLTTIEADTTTRAPEAVELPLLAPAEPEAERESYCGI
jgi:hypothetical protein